MYNLLANETAASLRAFFRNTLPLLAEDWWARHVVNALTFQQQRRVEESRIESLAGQSVPSPNAYIQAGNGMRMESRSILCRKFEIVKE